MKLARLREYSSTGGLPALYEWPVILPKRGKRWRMQINEMGTTHPGG
jgi:hypothetical protein